MYRNIINPLVNFSYNNNFSYYNNNNNIIPLNISLSQFNVVHPDINLERIRSNIVNAMACVSISCISTSYYSYDCMAFIQQEIICFKLNIYPTENNQHILEFIKLSGDNFVFYHILFIVSKELECEISGSRELKNTDEADFSNLNAITEFIRELISKSSPRDLQIQGLQNLAACSRDIAASKEQFETPIFGIDGIWKDIVNTSLTLYSTNDLELNLIIVSTLVEILKVPAKWDNKFISSVYEVSNKAMLSENYHMRHEGIMLYYVIYQLIHDGVQDIVEFSNKVQNMDFTNDKPLIGIIDRLLD
jgi:hypothetical protein